MWSDKLVAHRGVETAHPFNLVALHFWGDSWRLFLHFGDICFLFEKPWKFHGLGCKESKMIMSSSLKIFGPGFMVYGLLCEAATKCATTEQNHGPKAPGCRLMLGLWRSGEF